MMRNFDAATPVGVRRVTPQAPGLRALAAIGAFWLFGVLAVLFGLALLDRLVKHHGMLFRTQIIAALFVASAIAAALALFLLWWEHRPQNSRTVEEVVPAGQPIAQQGAPQLLTCQVQKDDNHWIYSGSQHLEMTDAQLMQWACQMVMDESLTDGRWAKDREVFPDGRNQWKRFRAALVNQGLAYKESGASNARTLLTPGGRAFVRRVAEYAHARAHAGEGELLPPPEDGRGGGLLEDGPPQDGQA